jgi:hypothetical protein
MITAFYGLINFATAIQLIKIVVTYGTYVIGTSALIFGIYDLYHLKWTGDLKIMATALDLSAFILFGLAYFNLTNPILAIIFGFTYMFMSYAFLNELKNPNLKHEPRKQKQWWQIINEYIDKLLAKEK